MTEAPNPAAPANDDDKLKLLSKELAVHILRIIDELRAQDPTIAAAGAAGEIITATTKTLEAYMGTGAVRMAMLIAFEQTHASPMSFVDINHMKQAMVKIAAARREAEGKGPGLILPPDIVT